MADAIGLRLPDELYDLIAEEAERSGNSLQSIIRMHLASHYEQVVIEKRSQVQQTELFEEPVAQ